MKNKRIALLAREIWRNLPAWFMYYMTVLLIVSNISFLPQPRYDFVATCLLPYGVFLFFYYARLRCNSSGKPGLNKKRFVQLVVATSAIIGLAILLSRPVCFGGDRATHFDRIIYGFEVSNIVFVLLLVAHCLQYRGWQQFIVFFGAAFVYGMILESQGVTMGYFSEDNYHMYLPLMSAPVATMFGWSTVFYPCVFMLDKMREGVPLLVGRREDTNRRPWFRLALFTALIACLFDAAIDPYATAMGLWQWSELYNPGNAFYWFGVPIINYVSWFSAVFSFAIAYYYLEITKAHWTRLKRAVVISVAVPALLLLAACIEWPTLFVLEGPKGPSWTLLRNHIEAGMPFCVDSVHDGGEIRNVEHREEEI